MMRAASKGDDCAGAVRAVIGGAPVAGPAVGQGSGGARIGWRQGGDDGVGHLGVGGRRHAEFEELLVEAELGMVVQVDASGGDSREGEGAVAREWDGVRRVGVAVRDSGDGVHEGAAAGVDDGSDPVEGLLSGEDFDAEPVGRDLVAGLGSDLADQGVPGQVLLPVDGALEVAGGGFGAEFVVGQQVLFRDPVRRRQLSAGRSPGRVVAASRRPGVGASGCSGVRVFRCPGVVVRRSLAGGRGQVFRWGRS